MPFPLALPALLPALGARILGLLRAVPWQVWAILGLLLSFWLWGEWKEGRGEKVGESRANARWEKKQREANATFSAKINNLRSQIADWVLQGIAWRDAGAEKLRESEQQYREQVDELRKRRPTYVTQVAVSRCDLTRGVVLHFNDGAARANGKDDASAEADTSAAAVDASSGVSLDTFTAAIEDTQTALGVCRIQVLGWQRYEADIARWYEGLRTRINECIPPPPGGRDP